MRILHSRAFTLRTAGHAAIALAAYVAAAAGQTIPRGYEIVDLTSNNGVLERFPRINSRGDVVFFTHPPDQTQGELFLYEKATDTITQLTDDDVFDAFPDVADDGTIVWTRFIGPAGPHGPTGEIFMRTPDGVITQITSDEWEDRSGSINNQLKVVWKKYGPAVCGGLVSMDIFMYDGSEVSRLTTTGEELGYANQAAEINDLGQVVWTEYDFCDAPPGYNFKSRTMLYSNGQIQALPGGLLTPQSPDINDRSQVVWSTYDPAFAGHVVELWESGQTVRLTDYGSGPSINDHGHVAFSRDNLANWPQVWVWRDGIFTQVTNDANLKNSVVHLNDAGEAAWQHGSGLNLDIQMLRRFHFGDLNCDGLLDAFDIEGFILALLDPAAYELAHPTCDPMLADANADQVVDVFDIEPFIGILIP